MLPDGADFVEILALGVRALKLAIEESQLPEYKSIQELPGYDPGYVIDPRILADGKVPCVSLTCDEEDLPLLQLRISSKDGDWLGDATCNLWSPMGFFVSQAHGLITQLKTSGSPVTDEDFEGFIVRQTANMLKAAFPKSKIEWRLRFTHCLTRFPGAIQNCGMNTMRSSIAARNRYAENLFRKAERGVVEK